MAEELQALAPPQQHLQHAEERAGPSSADVEHASGATGLATVRSCEKDGIF